jgi:hypothetical protein
MTVWLWLVFGLSPQKNQACITPRYAGLTNEIGKEIDED